MYGECEAVTEEWGSCGSSRDRVYIRGVLNLRCRGIGVEGSGCSGVVGTKHWMK